MNKKLIRIEGLVIFALGIYFYFSNGYNWTLFLLLLLIPDVSMIGYAVNQRVGAYLYNSTHTFAVPLLLLLAGQMFSLAWLTMISFIWIAHIGMDRMMGYGLKYESGFKDTHLQRL